MLRRQPAVCPRLPAPAVRARVPARIAPPDPRLAPAPTRSEVLRSRAAPWARWARRDSRLALLVAGTLATAAVGREAAAALAAAALPAVGPTTPEPAIRPASALDAPKSRRRETVAPSGARPIQRGTRRVRREVVRTSTGACSRTRSRRPAGAFSWATRRTCTAARNAGLSRRALDRALGSGFSMPIVLGVIDVSAGGTPGRHIDCETGLARKPGRRLIWFARSYRGPSARPAGVLIWRALRWPAVRPPV
jgi:hypothetical protein